MHKFDANVDSLNYKFDYNPIETEALRSRSYAALTLDDLRRIALWKLDRVVDVPQGLLDKLQALATTNPLTARSKEATEVLNALVACNGVGYPMASAFLKFLRPDVFPIIDVRAYRALHGKRLRTHQYTTDLYLQYTDELLGIANALKRPLAEIDEQLYCYDKEKNGRIDA